MFFPEPGGFRVTLHGGVDGNDVALGYRWSVFVVCPPLVECFIGSYKEALFWGWSFCKCVGYVSAIKEHIFTGCYCVE
jgi:hypothetical protein